MSLSKWTTGLPLIALLAAAGPAAAQRATNLPPPYPLRPNVPGLPPGAAHFPPRPGGEGALFPLPPAPAAQVAMVQRWYQRFLRRPADPEGLRAYIRHMNAVGVHDALAVMLGSDEYFNLRGGTPVGFIIGLYDDLLGREPTLREVLAWEQQLVAHGSRHHLVNQFQSAYRGEIRP
ncbi:MAG TPA: hypothetical protein VIL46_12380 [Gemmataceae bacterium]